MTSLQSVACLLEQSLRIRRDFLPASAPTASRETFQQFITARPPRTTPLHQASSLVHLGPPHADLMFVSEIHDAESDPFLDPSGEIFTKILSAMGISKDDVCISCIRKSSANSPDLTDALRKQISLVRPKILVSLGNTATHALLGHSQKMADLHGRWQSFDQIPLLPTYHPSYLIHNTAISAKRMVWEDMLQVMEKLDLPISPKQRAFFQKK